MEAKQETSKKAKRVSTVVITLIMIAAVAGMIAWSYWAPDYDRNDYASNCGEAAEKFDLAAAHFERPGMGRSGSCTAVDRLTLQKVELIGWRSPSSEDWHLVE